jgi:hypothetical protein
MDLHFLLGILKVTDESAGSGFIPKCHGSGSLLSPKSPSSKDEGDLNLCIIIQDNESCFSMPKVDCGEDLFAGFDPQEAHKPAAILSIIYCIH